MTRRQVFTFMADIAWQAVLGIALTLVFIFVVAGLA